MCSGFQKHHVMRSNFNVRVAPKIHNHSSLGLVLVALFLAIFVGSIASAGAQTIYEAENATMVGPSASTTYSGYSGTGYADYNNNSADYVEFSLNASAAGSYPIAFRYANGGTTGSRPLELKVNGAVSTAASPFQ